MEKAISEVDKSNSTKVNLKEYHSKDYLKKLKETTYKGYQKVVFVLPNCKEVTYE